MRKRGSWGIASLIVLLTVVVFLLYKESTTPAWFLNVSGAAMGVSALGLGFAVFFIFGVIPARFDHNFGAPALWAPQALVGLCIVASAIWFNFMAPNLDLRTALEDSSGHVKAAARWNPSSPVVLRYRQLVDAARAEPTPASGMALLNRELPWLKSLATGWGGREAVARARLYQTGLPTVDGEAIANAVRDGVWTQAQDDAHHQALIDAVAAAPTGPARDRLVAALGRDMP